MVLTSYPVLHTTSPMKIAEEIFEVTTPNPYRDRTHRIRIWCCFLQRLRSVCCDVTWYLPDRLCLLLVCFCLLFSFLQHHPASPSSSHGPTLKRLHWNGGPFHLCHSSILLWYVLTSPNQSTCNSSEDFIAMCTASTPLFSRFFWRLSFWPIDAVVLWDWIISLPREYRFVRSPHAPLFLILPFLLRYGELTGLQSR